MNYKFTPIIVFLWLFCSAQGCLAVSAYDNAKLTVWVSEAVVSTYTFDYKDLLQQQKQIAKYFTAEGWINYNKALQASKILESVKKNSYYVSAVPTMVIPIWHQHI